LCSVSVQDFVQSTPNLPVLQLHFSLAIAAAPSVAGSVLAQVQAVSHLAPILPSTHLSHFLASADQAGPKPVKHAQAVV